MRAIVYLLLFILGTQIQAAPKKLTGSNDVATNIKDTRIGPVVGIQRDVIGVYNNCLYHMIGDATKPMYAFSCQVMVPLGPKVEVLMTPNPVFQFTEQDCQIEAKFNKDMIVMSFGNPRAPLTFDEAKTCLEKGTKSISDKFSLLIFKAENSGNTP